MNESHEQVNEDNGKTVLHSSLAPHKTSNVILKTAVACVSSGTQSTDANILLDEGAQRSFITESLARKLDLGINGTEIVHLSGFGEQNRQVRHMQSATIYLQTDDVENIPLEVLIIPEIALPIQTHMKSVVNMRHLHGLKLAHPITEDDMFDINLLIGADYYWSIVGDKIIRGNGPTAVESKLGYLLSGPTTSIRESNRSSILNVIVSHKAEECNLTKFWEIESLGIEDSNTKTELEEFQTIYENSSVSFLDNKYVAKLPWKTNHSPLPSNKTVAFRRTENVIRRLSKEPQLLQKYGEIIEEQEKRGFIEKVEEDLVKPNTKLHYIPHHAVKKDSATTPIRIVYDCSCRQTPDTASLNDCLLNVPPKLNNVTAILLRFRMNKYAVCTDIEKAFLNVGLDIEDRDVTRFFWLSNPTDPSSCITTYRFKSVLFGATCSPFILNAVLSKHINNHQTEFTDNLMRDLYVDNIVSSFNSEDELSQYFKVVRKLFTDGGFNLRAWASNNKLLQQLAESEKVIDTEQVVKVLGLRWNTDQDTLKYAENILDTEIDLITKREVLRESSKIYDPLGIISPVTVRGKMFMQTLWGENMKWDEPLPDHMRTEWIDIRKDINEATKTVIHRHYFTNCSDSNSDNVIHVFMDASMKAYGACAYLVSEGKSSLLMSRNRVAPLKQLTIPRLELMAAVIGSRLLSHILSHINVNRVILWSDSQIVLSWLSSKKTLKQFVANRVKEIKELTEKFTWKYCPSESNPADLLSRGITTQKFRDNMLWMNGPDWLTNENKWPEWKIDETQIMPASAQQEVTVDTTQILSTHSVTQENTIIDIDRFNSFKKLLRVIAYVERFIFNCRSREKRTGNLNTQELQNATYTLIQEVQRRHFLDVKLSLQNGETKTHNLVKQLKLYLDKDNLIRCEGRIHNAPLDESTKFPILLPAKDRLTRLVIMDAHISHLHSGLSSTVTLIRQTYWIPTIRQVANSILRKCVTCKKVKGRPYTAPDPPPLPKDRLREAPPFTVTGVDFTGALTVKNNDGTTSKAYICLFTCASTRAVHLEVVDNLTEETFILAFRRFVSRKSLPKTMISDNATTYIAAAKHIENLTRSASLTETLNNYGTTWTFIPKRAPWYGGFWERLIGITKDCVKKVLGRSLINIELLKTIVTEVETIMNDRPLTYVSSDPLDEPLTPSHLLYGRRITTLPYPDNRDFEHSTLEMTHESVNKLSRLKSQIIQQFWCKWKHEYLTSLREYHRNTGKDIQTIKVGDVVQVYEESPRTKWNLAVIDQLNIGGDGKTRSAVIRTKHGLTSRPITKLYPLEVSENRDFTIDNNCDLNNPSTSRNLSRKAKSVAIEKLKKWTKGNNS
ncbi:uncharacterized protein LOC134705689 [Mytilus trossulus]|uniref:uncharacterized protein LOC134705689 n=1 Tax=Mytilus trossulus TaxID=6551 RepID=UPI003005DD0F